MEKISVVIPLYNKEKSVIRAVQSVLNQSYLDFELLVINDGSTDNSVNQLSEIKDERLNIINKSNGGVSSARNLGLSLAKFDYVAFLDADDTWKPDFLEKMNLLIEKAPSAALYGARQDVVLDNGNLVQSSVSTLSDNFIGYVGDYFLIALKGLLFHTSCVVVNKKLLNNKIFFDESLIKGEDLDFYFNIALRYKVAYFNKVLSCYHKDAENRAMQKYCPLNRRLIGNIEKYKSFLNENNSFRVFISNYVTACVGRLTFEGVPCNEIRSLYQYIHYPDLSLSKKVYLFLPCWIQKVIYKWKKLKYA